MTLHSLKAYNTFALESVADEVVEITDLARLREYRSEFQSGSLLVLGEGSNIILASRIHQPVAIMRTRGIATKRHTDYVEVCVAAGENWHQLVLWSLQQGYSGLENMALIPGSVGAAPVQNIGAYGVELSNLLQTVTVMDLQNGEIHRLGVDDCAFGYRDSLFKKQRHRFAILDVTLRLSITPTLNVEYPDLQAELKAMQINNPLPAEVAEAVMRVRKRKLPDPGIHPNVGSFFKNPVVSPALEVRLRQQFPQLKSFVSAQGVKLAAAQLIDLAGWKRKSAYGVMVWPDQPLVLVNQQATDGARVLQFAESIARDVLERFGVRLETEPDTTGFN
jgi:UDP-N-acetylmuramate dehydrogenase